MTTQPASKKILLIAANPAVSTVTKWPVGFWWAELPHPYWVFSGAGYEVEIRSPNGGALQADSYSDPEDESGYSADDVLSLGFKKSAKHRALIEDTKSLADVDPAAYDAIFVIGGIKVISQGHSGYGSIGFHVATIAKAEGIWIEDTDGTREAL